MVSLQQLARSSSFIFSGTVLEHGKSTVPAVPPNKSLVTVQLERDLLVNPVLGDLRGKSITVVANNPQSLSAGQRVVFFANSWVHGRGIAVRELDHVDIEEEDNVAAEVTRLPLLYLADRLQDAVLVVDAKVASITPPDPISFDRKAALWAKADLDVMSVLHGKEHKTTTVNFPTAEWPPWRDAPRLKVGQRGIFLLHTPSKGATRSEALLKSGTFVALDAADVQPKSQLAEVKRLLANLR